MSLTESYNASRGSDQATRFQDVKEDVALNISDKGVKSRVNWIGAMIAVVVAVGTGTTHVSAGPVLYVATNGNDGNPGTQGAPFRTISKGVSLLTPGAALYIRGGTYEEELYNRIPGGESWSKAVTVAAYPGETATIRPGPGASYALYFEGPTKRYIIIRGLILDGTNARASVVAITGPGTGRVEDAAHHIRIENTEIKNSPGSGVMLSQLAYGNEFRDCNIHDNGTDDFSHGLYIGTDGNLVERCRIHRNSGWGVHIYSSGASASHNIVRYNWIHDNARIGQRGAGIILSSGTRNLAYNNLIWNNRVGIQINYGVSDAEVYHNTVYANIDYGIHVGGDSIDTRIQNNIVYRSGISDLTDDGSRTVKSHNLVGQDPAFHNTSAFDFRLRAISPAINAGITLDAVKDDFVGMPRPQGFAHTIGAFEFLR